MLKRCFFIFFILSSALVKSQTPGTVNEKIIEFAKKNMGKKVDRGECWDLANSALNYAGANWTPPYGFGDKADYKNRAIKPADILQFSNVKFLYPNRSYSFPQHTAIVYKVNKNLVTVFHQN